MIISSVLPDVKPQDIELYIDSRRGKILLKLNSDGTFSFPLRKDLLDENPFIIANQPKGSMQLKASIDLRGSVDMKGQVVAKKYKMRYADLFSIRAVQERTVGQIAGALKDHAEVQPRESITWAEFTPAKPTKFPALIHGRGGNIKVHPDSDGVIRIKYDSKLAGENPFVTFPTSGELKVFSNIEKSD